jgi:hypothetical protein
LRRVIVRERRWNRRFPNQHPSSDEFERSGCAPRAPYPTTSP